MDKLKEIASDPDVLVFVRDRNGVYIYANEAYYNTSPMTPEQVIGCTNAELYGADQAAKWDEEDERVLSGASHTIVEDEWLDPRINKLRRFLNTRVRVTIDDEPHLVTLGVEVYGDTASSYEIALAELRAAVVGLLDATDPS